jgi:hypothetical protein
MAYDTQIDPIAGETIASPVYTPESITTPTVSDVYSSQNIETATTRPTAKPDDLLGIRNQIYYDLGVTKSQNEYNAAYKNLLNYQSAIDKQQLEISGQPLSMNLIRGEQARASELASYSLSAQQRALDSIYNSLSSKKAEAESQYAIKSSQVQETRNLMLQYPGAKIKWGDSTEKIAKKLDDYAEDEEKKAYKKELKKMAMTMGISTKGSRKELENRIGKYNGEAASLARQKAELELSGLKRSIASAGSGGIGVNLNDPVEMNNYYNSLFGGNKNNQNTPTTIPTTSQNADYGTGALDYWYDPKPIS